jgi:hypothetical protein
MPIRERKPLTLDFKIISKIPVTNGEIIRGILITEITNLYSRELKTILLCKYDANPSPSNSSEGIAVKAKNTEFIKELKKYGSDNNLT